MSFVFVIAVVKSLPHVTEGSENNRMPKDITNNKTVVPKISNALHEIRDWWNEQLTICSDDD